MKKHSNFLLRLMRGTLALSLLALVPAWAFSQDPAAAQSQPTDVSGFLFGIKLINFLLIIIGVELLLIVVMLGVKDPKNLSLGSIFANLTGKTASDEVMDHSYDGIHEIDNPVPAWLKYIFYGTIAWAFAYLVYYHFIKTGYSQMEEYYAEMQEFEVKKAAAPAIKLEDLKVSSEPAVLEAGKKVFASNCVSCHGANGQGDSGPNLTDKFWIHGGTISQVYTTVSEGVPGKPMIAWKSIISDQDRIAVSSYILGVLNKNPQKGRAEEGTLFEGDPDSMPGAAAASAPADSSATDTTKGK